MPSGPASPDLTQDEPSSARLPPHAGPHTSNWRAIWRVAGRRPRRRLLVGDDGAARRRLGAFADRVDRRDRVAVRAALGCRRVLHLRVRRGERGILRRATGAHVAVNNVAGDSAAAVVRWRRPRDSDALARPARGCRRGRLARQSGRRQPKVLRRCVACRSGFGLTADHAGYRGFTARGTNYSRYPTMGRRPGARAHHIGRGGSWPARCHRLESGPRVRLTRSTPTLRIPFTRTLSQPGQGAGRFRPP
jgi:hypothetical protein